MTRKEFKSLFCSEKCLVQVPEIEDSLGLLDLSFNGISSVSGLGKCADLEVLDLRGNSLQSIGELFLLSGLKRLLLSRNAIVNLPATSGLLVLCELALAFNSISKVPSTLLLSMPLLEVLDLSFNQVQSLPLAIGELTRLKKLVLANNSLQKLPDTLRQLRHLRVLDVSHNNVSGLPGHVFDSMHSLTRLLLNDNPLTQLSDVSGLISLLVLDLSRTLIVNLEPSICVLNELQVLHLDGEEEGSILQSLNVPSASLVLKGVAAIQAELRQVYLSRSS